MKKQQIVILHYAGPPIVGGVESTIYHHSILLSESGYDVKVVAGRGEKFHKDVEFFLIPEIDSRHPVSEEIGKELAKGYVAGEFYELRDLIIQKIRPILSVSKVCIVHNALSLHFNLALTAALKILSDDGVINIIAWNHDFSWRDQLYLPDLHNGYPWDLLRNKWPNVKYVVVSQHRQVMQAELLGVPESHIQVVSPGIDLMKFLKLETLTQRLVQDLDLVNANPLMLLPARIIPRKNIQFAIKITAALKKIMPNPKLLITGPPDPHNPKIASFLESLQNLRRELGVEDDVFFLFEKGQVDQPLFLPDDVVADLYRFADMLLFPSYREGFGIPVLEAGIVNLPVFAADIPTVRESAMEYAHLFDPNGDPQKVAEDIGESLRVSDTYNLRLRVLNNFTWRAIIDKKIIPILKSQIS